ncbi:DUF445 family protein [Radiobacillus kanasensis]|uniref:DUF445 domain-containing protein n=1 Tax=Radiobacillus kanasensis TaxID=2844358 RepID=UPI001E4E7CAF|nr:DUF445 family protein [Radiobacillus kanasensis]UFU00469.1 DUF445 family protein [Radiobacillus kanasensis]
MEFLLVLFMIIIGALIGGITNSIAIKMLFRPYEAKYIGKWKVPFTPGLIPKRREELAKQLGRMVVEHLLTPEGMKKRLENGNFKKHALDWVTKETDKLYYSNQSLQSILHSVGLEITEDQLRAYIHGFGKKKVQGLIEKNDDRVLRDFLDDDWLHKSEKGINQLSTYIQKALVQYIGGPEARQKILEVIQAYLGGKGFFGNMISSFLGNDGLADNIQPLLVQYAESEDGREMLERLISKEWEKLLNKKVRDITDLVGEELLDKAIHTIGTSLFPNGRLNQPLTDWLPKAIPTMFNNRIVPSLINKAADLLIGRMDVLFQSLKIEDIVEAEVASFPIRRVEQLVLNISSREFKMITYLGALLGGMIGLIQGIFVLLLS